MKLFYTFIFVATSSLCFSQAQVGASFRVGLPQGAMKNNINAVGNFYMDMRYPILGTKRFSAGAEVGVGTYANLRQPVTFNFGNGNPTQTNINYSSNTAAVNGLLQYDLLSNANITPYVQLKTGVQTMYSRIFIEDPNDVDGCRPLESKSITSDYTMVVGGAAGFRFALKSRRSSAAQFLDIGVSYMYGGNIDYINAKRLKDHDPNAVAVAQTDPEATPINMRFINVQSNVIHSHKVGELYNSKYRVLDIKLTYSMSIN